MGLSNTDALLIALLVLVTLFIVFGCKLSCGVKREGWIDQIQDHVSNPFFGDIFSSCEKSMSVPRLAATGPCQESRHLASPIGSFDKSVPLSVRAQHLAYQTQAFQDQRAADELAGGNF